VTAPIEDLDQRGFVRVTAEGEDDLWLTCQQCGKSDHFLVGDVVQCSCGASYDHTVTPAGTRVEMSGLTFVPFEQGPMALADLELDPRRLAVFALVVLLLGLWWSGVI
jgi:hypothetical protein